MFFVNVVKYQKYRTFLGQMTISLFRRFLIHYSLFIPLRRAAFSEE